MARLGAAWRGLARRGLARQGRNLLIIYGGQYPGKARPGWARRGLARRGMAGHGEARQGEARHGMAGTCRLRAQPFVGSSLPSNKGKTKLMIQDIKIQWTGRNLFLCIEVNWPVPLIRQGGRSQS